MNNLGVGGQRLWSEPSTNRSTAVPPPCSRAGASLHCGSAPTARHSWDSTHDTAPTARHQAPPWPSCSSTHLRDSQAAAANSSPGQKPLLRHSAEGYKFTLLALFPLFGFCLAGCLGGF